MEKGANGRHEKATCSGKIFPAALLCLFSWIAAHGQSAWELRLLPLDGGPGWLEAEAEAGRVFSDTTALYAELSGLLRRLHGEAYLEASVDTLDCRDSTCVAFLHAGPRYEWARLANGNIPGEYLEQSGYRERLYRQRPFAYAELRALQEDLLAFAENHGYPFAEVWLDSLRIEEGQVYAGLFMERGRLILFDTLQVEGDVRIADAYLEQYLGLRPGTPYSRERLLRSRERLRELPFLRTSADPTVLFRDDRAVVSLPLEKQRASRFDFIIGVLPNSNQTGRMLITGDFEGELINQFGLGERLYARFEQLRPQTQELELAFDYPYTLGLPLGVDVAFSLYKRDTTFIDLITDLGLSYLFEGGNYLKAYWEQRASNLLSIDEDRLLATQQLPPTLDLRNSTFGLELLFQRLDYRYNPRRGWSAFFKGGAGIKRILRNSKIEALELGSLYDSLELRSFQYRLQAELAGFLPLFSRSTLMGRLRGGFLISQQPVYQNEQYRIGGNQLLRGFDEEFFFATHYTVGTAEYRLLTGQNAYLYLFGDYGWVQDRTTETDRRFFPYGFGAGITFDTKAGLFGVNLAFGGIAGEQSVDFSSPKVHFGYVSRF